MSRYVYPGGQSPLLLHDYLREVARSPFELISIDDDRHNYYLTCKRWARTSGRQARRDRGPVG